MGSWVLWTKPDDDSFEPTGELRETLVLHCSAPDVVRAVLASCAEVDVVGEAIESSVGPIVRIAPI